MPNPTGGYIAPTSLLNLPSGEYISVNEYVSTDEQPQGVNSSMAPADLLVEPRGNMLTTRMVTESGAGIQATDDHRVLIAIPQKGGYQMKMKTLSELQLGELVVINPSLNGSELKFNLSPVASVEPYAIEEVYEVQVDSPDGVFLCNGLLNQGLAKEN